MIGSLSRSLARVALHNTRPVINQSFNQSITRTITRTINQTTTPAFTRSYREPADEDEDDDDVDEYVNDYVDEGFDQYEDVDEDDDAKPVSEDEIEEYNPETDILYEGEDVEFDVDTTDPLDPGKWSAIIDPTNPPRLSIEHYEMLTKIAGRKKQVSESSPDPQLDEAINNMKRMLDALSKVSPAIKRDADELGLAVEDQYRAEATRLAVPPAAPLRPRSVKLHCRFCAIKKRAAHHPELKLEFTNLSLLHRFINLRGMIYPRRVTGNCLKHQRKLATAIKRARFIGLLSHTSNWSVDGIAALDSMIETIPDIEFDELDEMEPNEEFFEEPVSTFHAEEFAPNDPNALPATNTAQ